MVENGATGSKQGSEPVTAPVSTGPSEEEKKEIDDLKKQNDKLNYRIVHLLRTLDDLDGKTASEPSEANPEEEK